MGDAMQNFFATKREQKKKKKKRFLLMQQKSKTESETQKQRPKSVVDISEPPVKPPTQILGIVPIESMATNKNQKKPLVRKNPGELNPVPKVPVSKPPKPRVIASPPVPKSIDTKNDVIKNTNTAGSHSAAMSWSSTGGTQLVPASTGRTRSAFPSQQERDLERQTRGRQFYDRHNARTSRGGYRGGNAGSHSSVRPHVGANQQKAKTKFDLNKFRRRDRRVSGNDRSIARGPAFSQRARLADNPVSRRAESGSIYKGNQLSAAARRSDDGANRKQSAASAPPPPPSVSTSTKSTSSTTSITSASRDASVEDTYAIVGAKPEDSSAPALQAAVKAEADPEAEKNASERISTGQTHRGSMFAKTEDKGLPFSDIVATPHSR